MVEAEIELPTKIARVFDRPRGDVMYRHARGGRGSAKSFSFAKMAAVWGYAEPLRILCTRDLQVSIKESFHAELKAAIASEPFLAANYDVGVDYLRCPMSGTEFLFRGLRSNTSSVKSMAKIDLTIVEEAEDVAEKSWLDLEATVLRQPRSEIWTIWNPKAEGSPVDMRFVQNPPPKSEAVGCVVNYYDNPWFPPGLEKLRKRQQEILDPATYAHIWEGAYLKNSKSQVLAGKVKVQEFTPGRDWDGPYHGMDYGFAQDPTAAVRVWIHDECLWVEYEAGKEGLEIDQTAQEIKANIPGIEEYQIRADSARPESTSYLVRHGLPRTVSVAKWPGSVEDGIVHLRSYRAIVVHPRCKRVIEETRLYSYKVDRLTGDVLPILVDAFNHWIDAIRYALAPLIQKREPETTAIKVQGL